MECEKCHDKVNYKLYRIESKNVIKYLCENCKNVKPEKQKCCICGNEPEKKGYFLHNEDLRISKFICDNPTCTLIMKRITMKDSCAKCGNTENVKLCTGCRKVHYCSVNCQREDRISHKKVCFL